MTYELYKLIHVSGLMLLFLGFGSLLFHGKARGDKAPKAAAILHGVGLLVMLTGGFGMLARLHAALPEDQHWPAYVIAKIVVWVLLGALPILHRKAKLPAAVTFLLAVGLAAAAAYMAITKSVFGLV